MPENNAALALGVALHGLLAKGDSMNIVKNEPVTIFVTIGALISAILYAAVPTIDDTLVSAIVDAVVVIGPIAAGMFYARSKVTPVAKLEREHDDNLRA